jgi:hypothetical protein
MDVDLRDAAYSGKNRILAGNDATAEMAVKRGTIKSATLMFKRAIQMTNIL